MHHETPQVQRARAGVILAVVVSAVGTYKGIESMTSPALPILQRELGATRAEIAWVLTGVLLTGPIATPIVGRLGDIWDKRRVLLAVLAVVGLGTLTAALSVSVYMLIVGQLLQGFGLCTVPLAVGIMRQTQDERRLRAGNGMMIAVIFAATALAMLVAGPIADNLHYSWLFWAPSFVLMAVFVAVWRLVPPCPPESEGGRIDFAGALLFGASLALLLLSLTNAPEWGWTSGRFLLLLAAATSLALCFATVERHRADPLVDLRILVSRQVLVAVSLMMMAGFTLNALLVAIPMEMQLPASTGYGLDASATTTTFVLVPGILIGAIAPVASILERRLGMRGASMCAAAVVMASCVLVAMAHGNFWGLLGGVLVCGAGTGVAIAHAMNIVVEAVPADRVGAFSGMNFVVKAVAATTGAQIAASILSTSAAGALEVPSYAAFAGVFLVCGGVCLAVLFVAAATQGDARGSAATAADDDRLRDLEPHVSVVDHGLSLKRSE